MAEDKDLLEKARKFDPTAELWDRVVSDILERGAPCYHTIEKLVEEACELPPNPEKAGK